jgi:hypothetical protein
MIWRIRNVDQNTILNVHPDIWLSQLEREYNMRKSLYLEHRELNPTMNRGFGLPKALQRHIRSYLGGRRKRRTKRRALY